MLTNLVLRNHVRAIVKEAEVKVWYSGECETAKLMLRRVKSNSAGDAQVIETVLAIPAEDNIYQLAVSEPFYKFDVYDNSRNYREAVIMSDTQFQIIQHVLEKLEKEEKSFTDAAFLITRECKYFDVKSPEWNMQQFEYQVEVLGHDFNTEVHWVVYGRNEAWDFGDDEMKAAVHFDNLVKKDEAKKKAAETIPDTTETPEPTSEVAYDTDKSLLQKWVCEECGHEFEAKDPEKCPECGSDNLTDI